MVARGPGGRRRLQVEESRALPPSTYQGISRLRQPIRVRFRSYYDYSRSSCARAVRRDRLVGRSKGLVHITDSLHTRLENGRQPASCFSLLSRGRQAAESLSKDYENMGISDLKLAWKAYTLAGAIVRIAPSVR